MAAVVLSGLQYDRMMGLIGADVPPSLAAPVLRLVHTSPDRRSRISDEVHLNITPADAEALQAHVWSWLIVNLAAAEDAEEPDVRRRLRRFASSLSAINYRVCTATRVPVAITLNAAWRYSTGLPAGRLAAIGTAFFSAQAAEASALWVTQHRLLARALEKIPSPSTRLRHQSLAKPLPVGQGTVRAAVPAWWTLLAPTAPFRHLPPAGTAPTEAAVGWYTEARTTARLDALAESSDVAGWAIDWSVRFIARCVTNGQPDRATIAAVRDGLHTVVDAGDPFEGGPLSPIDLWADPDLTRVLAPRDFGPTRRVRRNTTPSTKIGRSHV